MPLQRPVKHSFALRQASVACAKNAAIVSPDSSTHTISSDSFQCINKSMTSTPIIKRQTQQPSLPTGVPTLSKYTVPTSEITCACRAGCQKSESCVCKKNQIMCSFLCHPGHPCFNCLDKQPPCATIDLLEESGIPENAITCTTGSTGLTTRQRQIIKSGKWLDDTIMNMGQKMLQKQHPQVNGLQSVLLGQTL